MLLHTLSFCDASYFVVLRVGWVFGVFAASYFIVLRIGWVFGVFGVFAASYFVVLRVDGFFWGFLGFLLLYTLSFCKLGWGFYCFILCRSENWFCCFI